MLKTITQIGWVVDSFRVLGCVFPNLVRSGVMHFRSLCLEHVALVYVVIHTFVTTIICCFSCSRFLAHFRQRIESLSCYLNEILRKI